MFTPRSSRPPEQASSASSLREKPLVRRGLMQAALAGGLAGVSALLAGALPKRAQAASSTNAIWYTATDSQISSLTGGSAVIEAQAASSSNAGVWGENSGNGPGVKGNNTGTGAGVVGTANTSATSQTPAVDGTNHGAGWGVSGISVGGVGVVGQSQASTGTGVAGVVTSSGSGVEGDNQGSGVGVWGHNSSPSGSGAGVLGSSDFGIGVGVLGQSFGTPAAVEGENFAGAIGVLGQSTSGSGSSSVGVYGQSMNGSGGIGVLGLCSNDVNSVGVYAQSATGKGFLGFSNATAGVGAVGVNSTSGIGVYGISSGGYAGVFSGSLYVSGALSVAGPKSAVVRDAGGTLRRMYSMESPESWFEDFGTGQLSGGSATVQLEPGFAGTVHSDGYRVFLTPQGDSNGLFISSKTASSFTVHEQQGGKSNVAFDYRVVAKRKDIAGVRLEPVAEPVLPDVPSEPLAPQPPPTPPANPKRIG